MDVAEGEAGAAGDPEDDRHGDAVLRRRLTVCTGLFFFSFFNSRKRVNSMYFLFFLLCTLKCSS